MATPMWPCPGFGAAWTSTSSAASDAQIGGPSERGLGTSELSVLSLSDSEEPESEDPSTDKSDEGPSSGAYSDFAMDVESAEEPDDRSEDLDQEMGMDHHSEKDDDMGRRFIDDSSGLFT